MTATCPLQSIDCDQWSPPLWNPKEPSMQEPLPKAGRPVWKQRAPKTDSKIIRKIFRMSPNSAAKITLFFLYQKYYHGIFGVRCFEFRNNVRDIHAIHLNSLRFVVGETICCPHSGISLFFMLSSRFLDEVWVSISVAELHHKIVIQK